jgi:hypothetical protein
VVGVGGVFVQPSFNHPSTILQPSFNHPSTILRPSFDHPFDLIKDCKINVSPRKDGRKSKFLHIAEVITVLVSFLSLFSLAISKKKIFRPSFS